MNNLDHIDNLNFNNFISGINDNKFIDGKTNLEYIDKLHRSLIGKQEIHPEKGLGNIDEIQAALNLSLPQDELLNYLNLIFSADFPFIVGECWKPITSKSVENITEGMYYISNFGRGISDARCRHGIKILNSVETNNGYLRFNLRNKDNSCRYYLIHRIVKIEFDPVPNFENFQVNHFDGNKHNNCLWNLQWCTGSDNITHAYQHGLSYANRDHSNNVYITDQQADQIGQLLSQQKYTHREIAEIVGCTVTIVQGISSGFTRNWVYEKYNLDKTKNNKGNYYIK